MFETHQTHSQVLDYSIVRQLLMESKVMCDFAFDSGLKAKPADVQSLQRIADTFIAVEQGAKVNEVEYAKELTRIHNSFSVLIKPATPRSLTLLVREDSNSMLRFYGSVPLVKRFTAISVASLIILILVSVNIPKPESSQDYFNLFANDGHGFDWVMGMKYLLLLSAASLGACFSSLYTVNRFIKTSTFDSINESTYWARYTLGLMAGIMMALLIPLENMGVDTSQLHGLEKPTLALLGGFAANFVYEIMDRIVALMEASVKGDPKNQILAAEAQARQRLFTQEERSRMQQMQDLAALQRQIGKDASVEDARKAISEMVKRVSGGQ